MIKMCPFAIILILIKIKIFFFFIMFVGFTFVTGEYLCMYIIFCFYYPR